MEEERNEIITLIDDETGKEVQFDLVMGFDYEGKRYIALLPMDSIEGVGEDEVVILEVVKEKGSEVYKPIENPILLDEVFNEFLELFDEMIEEEEEDDE